MMSATRENIETALNLARAGHHVFPCHGGGEKAKAPMPFLKWRDASTTDEGQIRRWWQKWPDAVPGLDLAKSNLLVIDCDRHGPHDGVDAFGALMAQNNHDPDAAPLVATPNEGNHHFFRQPGGAILGNGRGALPAGVDVRGAGGYVIAPGAVMADGRAYECYGELSHAPELPEWLVAVIGARPGQERCRDGAIMPASTPTTTAPPPARAPDAEIRELLSHIDPDCGYDEWYQALMGIHAETGGAGLEIADEWSARGRKYPGSKALARKWASFRSTGVTGRTLAEIAARYGADLSAIAMRHRGQLAHYDPVEAAAAARQLIEAHDGTLHDAVTGEVVAERGPAIPTPQSNTTPAATYPPGIVGEIAAWITATARRPQPELAIGAALAIVGTVAGRQFMGPTESATHLYVLGLAPTGKGKDHPLQQISRIMAAARLSSHLGPSEFISMPAVVNFLMRKPLSVCAMDEFGGFMKRINSKRASGFESAISKVIRTMWSSSFAPYATPEWAQKESQTIFAPALTLFGASTPEQFYSAMEGASLEDGTLNRFLLLKGQEKVEERDPEQAAAQVPDPITDALRSIYLRSGEMAATSRNDSLTDPAGQGAVRKLGWEREEVRERYRAFGGHVEAIIDASPDTAPFYARTVEMAIRIATIVAVGRGADVVTLPDLEYGIGLATASATAMAEGAADYMAENENQANAQKVMRIVKSRGGRVKHRDLLVAMKHTMKAKDLRDLIGAMCEAGQLERCSIVTRSGPDASGYLTGSNKLL